MHERIAIDSLCFWGQPLPEVATAWRALQPRRVSFYSALLEDDLAGAQALVAELGASVETISHAFIDGHLDRDEARWRQPRARLSRVIDAACALGARSIYLVTGGHGALTWEEAAECFAAAIAPCVAQAQEAGVPLLVECAEPTYAHGTIAHSLRDAVLLAERAGIGVCLDVFACWAEAGLRASLERAMPRCHLIQVADYVYGDRSMPGRAVPGDGAIPLARILGWALEAGYTGGFDLELVGPRIDAEGRLAAARRAADRLGALLDDLGA
jgi:sugar phosphate isomerase/epimerase